MEGFSVPFIGVSKKDFRWVRGHGSGEGECTDEDERLKKCLFPFFLLPVEDALERGGGMTPDLRKIGPNPSYNRTCS